MDIIKNYNLKKIDVCGNKLCENEFNHFHIICSKKLKKLKRKYYVYELELSFISIRCKSSSSLSKVILCDLNYDKDEISSFPNILINSKIYKDLDYYDDEDGDTSCNFLYARDINYKFYSKPETKSKRIPIFCLFPDKNSYIKCKLKNKL